MRSIFPISPGEGGPPLAIDPGEGGTPSLIGPGEGGPVERHSA